MPTPEPFRITGPGSYRTREGKRVEVEHNEQHHTGADSKEWPWMVRGNSRHDYSTFDANGLECSSHRTTYPTDIIGPWTEPTRLSLAKAALEEAHMQLTVADNAQNSAARELQNVIARLARAAMEVKAAESEAAQLAAIPPALLEVARSVPNAGITCTPEWVLGMLARSHSVDPAVLRAAMGAKP